MEILPPFGSAALARALTLLRLAALPPFLALLVRAGGGAPHPPWGMWLIVLYLFIALSDLLDGPLARRGEAATPFWGRLDAGADVAFNALGLSVAAWIGLVGPWVPLGVVLLGGRFLWRARREPRAGLPEDGPGKTAGVLFYLLVGGVVLELALPGTVGRWALARAGDGLFLMSLVLLLRGRGRAA